MKIAIIGAGLIGRKRALSLPKGVRLELICDVKKELAETFAKDFSCREESDWKKVITDSSIDAVIVSTPNKYLPEIAAGAISNGKHVLIEKPGARNAKDFKKIQDAYKKKKVVVMVGYNHRFHPAIMEAKKIIDSKKYGEVMFMRAKYGHGGRLGYEKEWRFSKDIAGGGEFLDQGCHLVDLTNHFAGKLSYHGGYSGTFFWNTELEDTSFVILKDAKRNIAASLSASCVEWKNLFCFEIMLRTAKIQIDGLGRSYGQERLTLYMMSPQMGPPKVKETLYPAEDNSWNLESKYFFDRIKKKEYSDKSITDAGYVLDIINQVYR